MTEAMQNKQILIIHLTRAAESMDFRVTPTLTLTPASKNDSDSDSNSNSDSGQTY